MRRAWPVAVVAILVLSGCGSLSTSTVADTVFENELRIPDLAPSTVENGVRTFELVAESGETQFPGQAAATHTWGFNGDFLGPTLRARRGEDVAFEIRNDLDETTSVHWHGMHLPAAMDGGPHQEIAPGAEWDPHWTIDQPAATLWYHPHPHGATEEHVFRGLAGMFIIDDDTTAAADLPGEYGVDDVPLIVQDRQFDDESQFDLAQDGSEPGTLGDTVMVNGTVGSYQNVTTERVRLRLLNGSTARTYTFSFPDRDMTLIATDGGLLGEPRDMDRVRLAPAERAEVVVSFEPGETVRMRSEKTDLGGILLPSTTGGNDEFDVMEFRAASELAPSPEPAWPRSAHADADQLREADVATTREFVLNTREINGEKMDMSRIDEVSYVGDTEVWEVVSTQTIPHSFHVHDVQFRVISIDGETTPPVLAGRKDTIYLEPNRRYRLLMRFDDYTDPETPYMYHCHMLLHEDEGMMGQFVVIEPGQEHLVGAARGHAHHVD